jgi:hypothetical protein
LPALAVGSDALENVLTLLALLLHAAGMPSFAIATLFLVGVCSLLKILGYVACLLTFGGGRLLLAMWPTQSVGKVGRRAPQHAPATRWGPAQ